MTAVLNRYRITDATLDAIASAAGAVDRGETATRSIFPTLGAEGVLDLGAPDTGNGTLAEMAGVIESIAARCMSTAFSLWATRMTIEYLRTAGTPTAIEQAERLATGEVLGITGMASAFKDLAGCGTLELTADPVDDGFVVSGPIRWASNLFEDSVMVTAARTATGGKVIVQLPLDTDGVTVGAPFSLLALGSTASSSLTLEDVRIPHEQVLTQDTAEFLTRVRPTFTILQTAMCLGVAGTSVQQAREGLVGVTSTYAAELDGVFGRHTLARATMRQLADRVGGSATPAKAELLALRLAAAEIATDAAGLELRTAGGKGYASATPANRRFREAAFIPVQSPSEGQLRWELASCH